MKKKVFISRSLNRLPQLKWLNEFFEVDGAALVKIDPIEFIIPAIHSGDLLLIHSVKGVELLKSNADFICAIEGLSIHVLCPGDKTAREVINNFPHSVKVHAFHSKDWEKEWEELRRLIAFNKVFSFQSQQSKKSYKALKGLEAVEEVEIYRSKMIDFKSDHIYDYVLLTSPLNAASFIKSKAYHSDTEWWCIGDSTSQEVLKSLGGVKIKVFQEPKVDLMIEGLLNLNQ